ncbi:CRTAC1 family protein [Jannaschia seohaensis]|uniref:Repeat domain-containing protein n=1 Tax=Jannaschia seohaensis TaxID=475081 RepID=A0A2Y9AUA3_9RHOB|nr:CRTAC1 family protein [Jannaschia seohaensis]PWJ19405.1 VCBS repeat protein [Jannaschia seohaensis]SSA46067.1 Repeat domain-containing protein [Jannaschia seohaensis]
MHSILRTLLLLPLGATSALAEPRFVDESDALPAPHLYTGGWEHFVGGGVAVLDCDGDDRPDLFAAGGAAPAGLFLNRSAPGGPLSFEAGTLPELTGVTGAYPLDIDGDDRLDLFVMRVGANVVLRGLGRCAFEDATEALGIDPGDGWTTAFSATWEGDGLPTLATGDYVDRDDPDGPFGTCADVHLHRPDGARYAPPLVLEPGFCPLSMLFSDWQRSGETMLRVSNDRHYYVREGREQMWRLDPLEELGPEDGFPEQKLWGMGIASRDVTGDGLPEVMLTSMGDQVLMLNQGDGYVAAPFAMGTAAQRPHVGEDGRPSTGWHAEFGDVDNDGLADLLITKGNVDQMPGMAMEDPNNLLMQQPDGTFREASAAAGIATVARSRGGALVDLNADGLLDVVVVNRRAPMELHRNVTPEAGAWLAVDPRQPGGNRRAVGATVEVRTEAGTQAREVTVGGGHAGGSAVPLHFGLGTAEAAEIRVIWPDGTVGRWREAEAGAVLRIERD